MINENLASDNLVSNEIINININIENREGKLVVSSRLVAEVFNKRHDILLRDIDNILSGCPQICGDLIKSSYINEQNKQEYREFLLTEKGLNLYLFNIQGYNEYKLAFLNEFERMKRQIANPFNVPTNLKEALRLALDQQEEIERKDKLLIEKDKQIEEQKPKVLFAETVESASNSLLVRDFVKVLVQKGVDIGKKRLFQWLRENGYLMKFGSSNNKPTQKAMEMGLFDIKETTVVHNSGKIIVQLTSKITGKGQVYFVNKFLANKINGVA
jgi:anti-repressor protein